MPLSCFGQRDGTQTCGQKQCCLQGVRWMDCCLSYMYILPKHFPQYTLYRVPSWRDLATITAESNTLPSNHCTLQIVRFVESALNYTARWHTELFIYLSNLSSPNKNAHIVPILATKRYKKRYKVSFFYQAQVIY